MAQPRFSAPFDASYHFRFSFFFAKKLFNATSIANANLLEDTTTKVLSLCDALSMKIRYTIRYIVNYIVLFNGEGNGILYVSFFVSRKKS